MMIYHVARSRANFEAVCESLRTAYDLPAFQIDSHDTWRYGFSSRDGLHLNVTRARGYRTVETWIPGCPTGVNYQIIVTAEHEPPCFVAKASEILGSEVARFYEREEPAT